MHAQKDTIAASRRTAVRRYYDDARDKQVQSYLAEIVQNSAESFSGTGSKRACLFVIGESNAGKTYTLERNFAVVPEFQPFINEHGELVRPLVTLSAPTPCNTKSLAIAILSELGVPLSPRMTEFALYELLRNQLRLRGVRFLHIDEMSNVLRQNTPTVIRQVQDTLKQLLNFKEWPLHTIYSGVELLAQLLEGDPQLKNRARVLRFNSLGWPSDKRFLTKCINNIAAAAELDVDDALLEDEFLERLLQASNSRIGTIIETIKEACCVTIDRGDSRLSSRVFIRNYERAFGCSRSNNIFSAVNWRALSPDGALNDLNSRSTTEDLSSPRKRKAK